MKKLLINILIVNIFSMSVSAYEFLGPKWPGKNPVVPYYINERGCEDVIDEWDYVQRAFDLWCNVPSTVIENEYKGMTAVDETGKDSIHIVKWAKDNDWPLGGNVVAVCYLWSNRYNAITDFDIVCNNKNWSWSTTGENGKMDVMHVVAHEAGHALGMAHSDVPEAVMWPKCKQGDVSNRKLHADDSTGISVLYPRLPTNNRAPIITSTPITSAIAGVRYQYQVTAIDPDGDDIRFSLRVKPLNMRIDSITGLITWFPKFLDLGSHDVIVVATDEMGAATEQRYQIGVSNLVVYTIDDTVQMGDTLYYNVYVTPMDEYGVLAGNIELSYNKNEMVILEVDTVGSVIAGASYAKNITTSMIKFAFAGADPFAGGGVLFRIKLLVFDSECGRLLHMPIVKAFFNDGDPVATTRDGHIFMPCGGDGYQVDGKVVYFGNRMGVGGADLELVELGMQATSTEDGFFAFTNVPHSYCQYTISAKKDSGDIRNAISAYDASLILRYVVDLLALNEFKYQLESADVNGNNMYTAYDAALILRFIVQYNDRTNIGKWVMVPEETVLKQLIDDEHNLEINAYMIGDVSGNWNDFDSDMPKRSADPAVSVVLNDFEQGEIATEEGPIQGFRTTIALDAATEDIYSGEFEITFASDKYKLYTVKPGALLNGFLCVDNVVDNKILIAFAGTEPFNAAGDLLAIEVIPVGDFVAGDTSLQSSAISRCLFNEIQDQAVAIEKKQRITPAPVMTKITSIYPNPFIRNVSIEYAITAKQNVRIDVFDLKGRALINLVNTKQAEGIHTVMWDGRDARGAAVSAQIYIIRFQSGRYVKNTKIYKIR